MKIAISNIAWNKNEDEEIRDILVKNDIQGIEVALSKIDGDIKKYRIFWEEKAISIVALQALLFGHPELTIFESSEIRKKTLQYLYTTIESASVLGAEVLVFGSPKNRSVGDVQLSKTEVDDIATEFFYALGEKAQEYNLSLCIEPNPKYYGCDFLTNANETTSFLKKLNHPSVQLHLDSAIMAINNESVMQTIQESNNMLRHFHISEKDLRVIGQGDVDHAEMCRALKSINYDRYLSIEMKSGQILSNAKAVSTAVQYVQRKYV